VKGRTDGQLSQHVAPESTAKPVHVDRLWSYSQPTDLYRCPT